jgi:hypothetical protein
MALYLGSSKQKLVVGNTLQSMKIYNKEIAEKIKSLLSSDKYILKDKNGLYLTTKDGE